MANIELRAFATATDVAFSENPTSAARFIASPPNNKGYRLFSECAFNASCLADGSLFIANTSLGIDAGKECVPGAPVCLQAPPLIIDSPVTVTLVAPDRGCSHGK